MNHASPFDQGGRPQYGATGIVVSTPKERPAGDSLRELGQSRGLERFSVRAEPPEAHRAAVAQRPDVTVLALQRHPAGRSGGRVASENDDVVSARVDEALDADLEVLIGVPDDAEALAPDAGAALDGVARVHVLHVLGDELARRPVRVPGVVDLPDEGEVLL